MEKKHIERLYALLERAEREKDTDTAAALRGAGCSLRTRWSSETLPHPTITPKREICAKKGRAAVWHRNPHTFL